MYLKLTKLHVSVFRKMCVVPRIITIQINSLLIYLLANLIAQKPITK
jgi:hypothetical protein